jgi:enoyl-[acyl-carrier protein] reductase I
MSPAGMPIWKSKDGLAVGKGATIQEFRTVIGTDEFEIDVAPWGEGHLKVNGRQIAHLKDAKDRRQAFSDLKKIAERYAQGKNSVQRARGRRIP